MNKLTDNRKQEIAYILTKVYPALTSFGYNVSTAMYADNNYFCLIVDALEGRNLLLIKTEGEKETEVIRVGITNSHYKIMKRVVKGMTSESTEDEKWLFEPRKNLRFSIWYNPKIIEELLSASKASKDVEGMNL